MEIKLEEYESMNQLDKIEFMLRENRLKEKFKSENRFYASIFNMFIVLILLVLYLFIGLAVSKVVMINIIKFTSIPIFIFLIAFFILCCFIDILKAWKLKKELDILQRKFFKINLIKETKTKVT